MNRRKALRQLAGISSVATGFGLFNSTLVAEQNNNIPSTSKLKIKIAGYNFDRCRALAEGRIEVTGCDSQFEVSSIGEMNTHIFSGPKTRAVTEIGLSPFMLAYANDHFRDYSLLPVFPLRLFRHKSIFIRNDRGIEKPADLRGKTIATTGYSSTSLTWIRGILQHEYGLKPTDVKWILSAKDSSKKVSGGPSKQENVLPQDLTIENGPADKNESDLLADGNVDALFHAAEPAAYTQGHPKITRLFPDYRQVERDYFTKTGIFPIMHAVAIRNDLANANPWLTKAVFDAYSESKKLAYKHLQKSAWVYDSLPWIGYEFESTRQLMGTNYWPYGIEPNRKTLESLFRYSYEQGLASRKLTIEELFHPSTLKFTEL